jgi:hypothetical protein
MSQLQDDLTHLSRIEKVTADYIAHYTKGSISSGHRPKEEKEAKFVEWDDSVQVRSFRPRFETSRLFGWERQKQVSILKLAFSKNG